MSYYNYTNDAIYELERQRTMNYGEEGVFPKQCELCGHDNKSVFLIQSHFICEDCACNELRDSFEGIEPPQPTPELTLRQYSTESLMISPTAS